MNEVGTSDNCGVLLCGKRFIQLELISPAMNVLSNIHGVTVDNFRVIELNYDNLNKSDSKIVNKMMYNVFDSAAMVPFSDSISTNAFCGDISF